MTNATLFLKAILLTSVATLPIHAFVSRTTFAVKKQQGAWIDRKDSLDSAQQQQQHVSTFLSMSTNNDNNDNGEYDLAVIGAGVVGVQAALLAASAPYHKKVVLIDSASASGALMDANGEDLSIGGPTGLFSKALRDVSKRIKVSTLRGMGLREDSVWNEITSSCVELASSNAQDVYRQLDYAGVEYMAGFASFPDGGATNSLIVKRENTMALATIKAKKVLIATGSSPFRPAGIPFDGSRIFDSDSINTLSYLPKSIVITGSGIIAVEFAKIFRNLGAEVTIIIRDMSPRKALQKIGLDIDVAATLVSDLIRSGIKIERGAQVGEFNVPQTDKGQISIELNAKGGGPRAPGLATEVKCEAYVAAVGRKPNTDNLNLRSAGIEVDEYGGLMVDCHLRATAKAKNVFGAGDVLGRPFLASVGAAQAKTAVISMFGPGLESKTTFKQIQAVSKDGEAVGESDDDSESEGSEEYETPDACPTNDLGGFMDPKSLANNPLAFPVGVWSSPEAAWYGYSKQQAQEQGYEASEGTALYVECLRGRVFNPNGMLKLVYDKPTGLILGVHICGDDACELIHYGMELVKGQRTLQDLLISLYSAVTFHELYRIAAQNCMDEEGARKRRALAGKVVAERLRKRGAN
eukprot:CAMPEP_0172474766 /NCGR_PEP_ID=MMETSP1065-20121228/69526_1 /TAXON_ID=265537 /ORGANISM="Amphiprora paludosa, Strain CCMP125" /LENGTH=635 /DNA_ID=CAMNT_0013232957 /DNA_START=68 /DNA_END=1975 /DNA_ORIENTATION=-